jgi:hypothetical protein
MTIHFSGIRFYKIANPPQWGIVDPSIPKPLENCTKEEYSDYIKAIEQAKTDSYKRYGDAQKRFQSQVEAQMTAIAQSNASDPDYFMTGLNAHNLDNQNGILVLDGPDLNTYLQVLHKRIQRNLQPWVEKAKDPITYRGEASRVDTDTLQTPVALNWARLNNYPHAEKQARGFAEEQVSKEFIERAEVIDITV